MFSIRRWVTGERPESVRRASGERLGGHRNTGWVVGVVFGERVRNKSGFPEVGGKKGVVIELQEKK